MIETIENIANKSMLDMAEANKRAVKVFKEYGIETEQIESYVYKVLNTDKEIRTDEIQRDLASCILITSGTLRYERVPGGNTSIGNIYYIVLGKRNAELAYKYEDIAIEEFGEALIDSYEYNSRGENTIDTIYAKGEI